MLSRDEAYRKLAKQSQALRQQTRLHDKAYWPYVHAAIDQALLKVGIVQGHKAQHEEIFGMVCDILCAHPHIVTIDALAED